MIVTLSIISSIVVLVMTLFEIVFQGTSLSHRSNGKTNDSHHIFMIKTSLKKMIQILYGKETNDSTTITSTSISNTNNIEIEIPSLRRISSVSNPMVSEEEILGN